MNWIEGYLHIFVHPKFVEDESEPNLTCACILQTGGYQRIENSIRGFDTSGNLSFMDIARLLVVFRHLSTN